MTLHDILDQLFFGPVAWTAAGLCLLDYIWRALSPGRREDERGLFVWWFVIQIAIAVILSIVSYLLAPRAKAPQPDATKDFEAPTAEAGRPIPVVFGTKTVKSPNVLWYGDKRIVKHKVKA